MRRLSLQEKHTLLPEIHHRNAIAEELDALPVLELNKKDNLVTLCHADHLKETANPGAAARRARAR